MSMYIKTYEIAGIVPAMRAMRGAWKSYKKSDTRPDDEDLFLPWTFSDADEIYHLPSRVPERHYEIGDNDLKLARQLSAAGTDHSKFLRQIVVWVSIEAPLYWWKQFDTYRMGVEKCSESTMHSIMDRELDPEDFGVWSEEEPWFLEPLNKKIREGKFEEVIADLPSSYHQKRWCMISFAALQSIYHARKNHKLKEWQVFCKWIEQLPYVELMGDIPNEE